MPAEEGPRCFRCGNARDVRRFCPACGTEQLSRPPADPIVGETFADRYVVIDLIANGAMGRVYRAAQRALNRKVALKVIHPHMLTSEEAVARFLREAQAASRLNHPNVVSVFDFGRTPEPQGGHLYLVMELLAGETLGSVLRKQPQLALPRIVRILRQVLAALAEAHFHGITHRDVKPDNIFVQQQRDGHDLVKVIDFGVARLPSRAISVAGVAVGTPQYIAPEVARGASAGAAADIYAVGVVLFEMLTGRPPFVAATPTEVMAKHISAPRPDPRAVAPDREIPARLAEVCVQAMAIDPAQRFRTAEAFADALSRAAARALSSADASWNPPSTDAPAMLHEDDSPDPIASLPRYRPPAESLYNAEELPLIGRLPDLAWAGERMAERGTVAIVLCGRTGVGRSRLLRELGSLGLPRGTVVLQARGPGPPLTEAGFAGLRGIIAQLAGLDASDDAALASGEATSEPGAAAGLRVVFGVAQPSEPGAVVRSAAAALSWAVSQASTRAKDARVALVIDDFDRLDKSSRDAIAESLSLRGMRRALLLASSAALPRGFPRERTRSHELRGVSREDALSLIHHSGAAALLEHRPDDVEPLYIEQVRRLWNADPDEQPATTLLGVVEQRMLRLTAVERRVLQAVALSGGGPLATVALALSRPEDLDEALRPLAEAGFVEVHQVAVALTHSLFGRVALDIAPAEAVADVHARLARALGGEDANIELRSHHALRGELGVDAFELVPRVAELRSARDDQQGAVSALWEGLYAAKSLATSGSPDGAATEAWIGCAKPLAALLVTAERYHEAEAALGELVRHLRPDDPRRPPLVDRLAELALELHRPRDAERLRREAREGRELVAAAELSRSPAVSGVMVRPDEDPAGLTAPTDSK